MSELKSLIADLIAEGARSGEPPEDTAIKIIRALKQRSRSEVKPKRGVGLHSQLDLFRGQ